MPSPEMRRRTEAMNTIARTDAGGLDPAARRRMAAEIAERRPLEPGVQFEPVDAGGVPAEWVWADGVDDSRVVMHCHGGAFIAGPPQHTRGLSGAVSRGAHVRFLGVDYRLAPEHPYPAAVDDALGVYRWLLDSGRDPAHVVFGGDSAGGNIVLAALLRSRDEGLPLPAGAFALSAPTDFTFGARTGGANVPGEDRSSPGGIRMRELYLAGHDPSDPYASPLLGDLAGLPPLYFEVSADEPLAADTRAILAKALAAGVGADSHETEGAVHNFLVTAMDTPEAAEGISRVVAKLIEWLPRA